MESLSPCTSGELPQNWECSISQLIQTRHLVKQTWSLFWLKCITEDTISLFWLSKKLFLLHFVKAFVNFFFNLLNFTMISSSPSSAWTYAPDCFSMVWQWQFILGFVFTLKNKVHCLGKTLEVNFSSLPQSRWWLDFVALTKNCDFFFPNNRGCILTFLLLYINKSYFSILPL